MPAASIEPELRARVAQLVREWATALRARKEKSLHDAQAGRRAISRGRTHTGSAAAIALRKNACTRCSVLLADPLDSKCYSWTQPLLWHQKAPLSYPVGAFHVLNSGCSSSYSRLPLPVRIFFLIFTSCSSFTVLALETSGSACEPLEQAAEQQELEAMAAAEEPKAQATVAEEAAARAHMEHGLATQEQDLSAQPRCVLFEISETQKSLLRDCTA